MTDHGFNGTNDNGEEVENAVPLGTVLIETYKIEKLINVGGMGEVYYGHNIHTGDPVAIKIVLPALAHDTKISALFQKEAQVLGRLFHDSIVRYHMYTFDKGIGRPCLVMEFVAGESLTDHLDYGPMPEEQVRRLIRRLADGLGQAHQAGTVHRDLTPNNVILPEGDVDQAKIIDFGIAKTTAAGSGTVLQGQFAGTLNFVSPEQLGDFGGTIDGRSDIYSLGLLAAACCRGETIDMGTSVVNAVNARRGVPDISDIYPGLRPILTAMLAPNPEHRPESMAKVVAMLDTPADDLIAAQPAVPQAIPNDRTVIAPMPSMPPPAEPNKYTMPPSAPPALDNSTPPGLGQPTTGLGAPAAPPSAPTAPPVVEPPKKKRRSPVLAILLVLALLGGGAFGVYQAGVIPGFAPIPPNTTPVAHNDTGSTAYETTLGLDVLKNDTDADGDPLTILSVETPTNGTASLDQGQVFYTPKAGYSGTDVFSYIITDDKGAEASAVVSIEVTPQSPAERVADHLAFLASGATDECTYLDISAAGPDTVTGDFFGTDQTVLETLAAQFEIERGATLNATFKQITLSQCPAMDFVRVIRAANDDRPGLRLDRELLLSGEKIQGTLKGFKDRTIWLALVDPEGGAYDVSPLIHHLGDDRGAFDLEIHLTDEMTSATQLMLMVVTDNPLTTAKSVRNGSPAHTLLPLLEQEFKAMGHDPIVALGYFRMEK